MSQELERVYTINLGKVLLSPNNQRAKRAINMVKEFARRHMKNEQIKLEEDLCHQIWKRGMKHPPRKIRVKMTKTDEGFILVSPYEQELEEAVETKEEKKKPTKEVKPESETKEIETKPEVKEVKEKKPKEIPKSKEEVEKPKTKEETPKAKEKPKPKVTKTKEEKPKSKVTKTKEKPKAKSKSKETKSKAKSSKK